MTRERLSEIIRFLAVGGGCFLIDYGLLYVFREYGGLTVLMASGLSFTISLVINYILCVTVVFHARKQTASQAALFITTSLMGLGVNQLCMWFFTDIAGLYYMIAKIGAAAVVTLWNYVTKRLILTKK